MELDEICPCDRCEWAAKCGEYELACRAFSSFVLRGTFEDSSVRMPSGQLFHKIFKEDDKALRNYLKSLQSKGGQNDLFE
jgi:hypothetical protein